jgi:hypothetical protein
MSETQRPEGHADKPSDAIKPKPAPGAYLLESTKDNAEYWANGARQIAAEGKGIEEVMQCYMQATNAWRNAAYGLAEKLHFAGYDPTLGRIAPSAGERSNATVMRQKLCSAIDLLEQSVDYRHAARVSLVEVLALMGPITPPSATLATITTGRPAKPYEVRSCQRKDGLCSMPRCDCPEVSVVPTGDKHG